MDDGLTDCIPHLLSYMKHVSCQDLSAVIHRNTGIHEQKPSKLWTKKKSLLSLVLDSEVDLKQENISTHNKNGGRK